MEAFLENDNSIFASILFLVIIATHCRMKEQINDRQNSHYKITLGKNTKLVDNIKDNKYILTLVFLHD